MRHILASAIGTVIGLAIWEHRSSIKKAIETASALSNVPHVEEANEIDAEKLFGALFGSNFKSDEKED